jgi:hypothetical protein
MKEARWGSLLGVFILIAGCTGYQAKGLTGGFSQTQLSEYVYEVRFQGNGYTSADRVGQFLLRRAAELTLETGHRYFVVGDQRGQSPTWGATFHNNSATVRILSSKEEAPNAADAVTVIHSTDAEAGGRLSDVARTQLAKYAAPLGR